MWPAKRTIFSLFCSIGLSACTTTVSVPSFNSSEDNFFPPQPEVAAEEPQFIPARNCGGELTSEQRVYLELVYKMEAQGQYYAALAHIDELEKNAESPQTFYLRAEALRHLGQLDTAEKYYQLLLGGCMTGYGLHGLGLLAIQANQLNEAETYLKHACRERPVDSNVHNDYGMVLLLRGYPEAARNEFLTAYQLDRNNRLPLENLIVLAFAANQPTYALQLAKNQKLSKADIERLSQRAKNLSKQVSIPTQASAPLPKPVNDQGEAENNNLTAANEKPAKVIDLQTDNSPSSSETIIEIQNSKSQGSDSDAPVTAENSDKPVTDEQQTAANNVAVETTEPSTTDTLPENVDPIAEDNANIDAPINEQSQANTQTNTADQQVTVDIDEQPQADNSPDNEQTSVTDQEKTADSADAETIAQTNAANAEDSAQTTAPSQSDIDSPSDEQPNAASLPNKEQADQKQAQTDDSLKIDDSLVANEAQNEDENAEPQQHTEKLEQKTQATDYRLINNNLLTTDIPQTHFDLLFSDLPQK